MLGRGDDGPPVYTYEAVPGVPPVSTIRFGRKLPPGGPPPSHVHSHDFLVLAYFERGGGSMWLGDREWQIEEGDVYLIAPGEVVGVGDDESSRHKAEGWGVFFLPEVLGPRTPSAFLSWRATLCSSPSSRARQEAPSALRCPPQNDARGPSAYRLWT